MAYNTMVSSFAPSPAPPKAIAPTISPSITMGYAPMSGTKGAGGTPRYEIKDKRFSSLGTTFKFYKYFVPNGTNPQGYHIYRKKVTH